VNKIWSTRFSSMNPTAIEDREEERRQDEFGARMKGYEASSQLHLDPSLPWICRMDGHCFSQFTRIFQKPFDLRISKAMAHTCADLMTHFNPRLVFTQSDEITMVFDPTPLDREGKQQTMMFDGRVQKITSLTAGYCSARFNYHLSRLAGTPTSPPDLTIRPPSIHERQSTKDASTQHERCVGGTAFFDSRIFNVPNATEAANAVLWRMHDCVKNSVSMLAQAHVPHSKLQGVAREGQLALLAEKGVSWENDLPSYWKYGILFKRLQYAIPVVNRSTQEEGTALRTRVQARSARIRFSPGFVGMIFMKYWNLPLGLPADAPAPSADAVQGADLAATIPPCLEEEFAQPREGPATPPACAPAHPSS